MVRQNHCSGHVGKKKLLLRAFWEKMLELKKIKTLGESIVKIETSVAELKIGANFREVIRTFPIFFLLQHIKKSLIEMCLNFEIKL